MPRRTAQSGSAAHVTSPVIYSLILIIGALCEKAIVFLFTLREIHLVPLSVKHTKMRQTDQSLSLSEENLFVWTLSLKTVSGKRNPFFFSHSIVYQFGLVWTK